MDFGAYSNSVSSGMLSVASGSHNSAHRPVSTHSLNVEAPEFTSYFNVLTGPNQLQNRTVNSVMDDFKKNGIDSPYDPTENTRLAEDPWHQMPVESVPETPGATLMAQLNQEQLRVLSTLPDYFIFELIKLLKMSGVNNTCKRAQRTPECRFCKNNGERETYYGSHNLKDSEGRVLCPVLRAFVCRRCGATGDNAHTIKYCPWSSDDERMKSNVLLRTIRLASGRRRIHSTNREHTFVFANTHPLPKADNVNNQNKNIPLDPRWEALEKKLTHFV